MSTTLVIEPFFSGVGPKRSLNPGQTLTFGRAKNADITVPFDDYLSGVHFSIVCRSDRGVLQDLNSRNGTFLNGNRIRRQRLSDGDRVMAGMSIFTVRVLTDGDGTLATSELEPTVDIETTEIRPDVSLSDSSEEPTVLFPKMWKNGV